MKLLRIFLISCVVVLGVVTFSACGSKKIKWSEWECIIAPTCSSQGIEARTNNKGKTEMRAIDVDTTAHMSCSCWITVVAPTCEDAGQEKRLCMDCGDSETREINATGHTWSEWFATSAAACETAGSQKRLCISCADIDTQSIPATSHTWSKWFVTNEPTCETAGSQTRLCIGCADIDTQSISATGHHWTEWSITTASTCTENGEEERVCMDCGKSEMNQVAATGHQWKDWSIIKSATCTQSGKEFRGCSACQEKEFAVIPSHGGHKWDGWQVAIPATCEKAGKESKTCTACNKTESRKIPASGHNYTLNQIAPTCEINGCDKYTCDNCGDSYEENKIDAVGHDWNDWNVAKYPTRDTDGYEERTCNNCGKSETIVLPSIVKRLSVAAEEFIAAIQNDVATLGNSSSFNFKPANYTELDIASLSTALNTSGNGSTSIVNGLIKLSNFNDQSNATVKLTVVLMLEGVKCKVVIDLGIGYESASGGYNWALVQGSYEIQE